MHASQFHTREMPTRLAALVVRVLRVASSWPFRPDSVRGVSV